MRGETELRAAMLEELTRAVHEIADLIWCCARCDYTRGVEPAERAVCQWIERVWNGGELAALDEFHPPTFLNDGRPSTPDVARAWHARTREAFPDMHYEIDELFTVGNRVIVRWTASGTHLGTLWGTIGATGRRVGWRGIHLLTVKARRIVEVWAASTLGDIAEQLGLELRPAGR